MTQDQIIEWAREAWKGRGAAPSWFAECAPHFSAFAALVAAHERERICAAIKEEDDHCATGDYMLDSDDCIEVAQGKWVRPNYDLGTIRAKSTP